MFGRHASVSTATRHVAPCAGGGQAGLGWEGGSLVFFCQAGCDGRTPWNMLRPEPLQGYQWGLLSPGAVSLGLSWAPRLPEARLTHGKGRTEPRHSFQLSVGVGEASSFTQDGKTLLLVFK